MTREAQLPSAPLLHLDVSVCSPIFDYLGASRGGINVAQVPLGSGRPVVMP